MSEAGMRRFRALFISDVHLGARGCQAELLLDFLRQHDADTIYLVGDIVDGWRLRSAWYWPQAHNDVVQKLLRKARKGARMIYVPGNHDEFLRDFYGTHFGGIEVAEQHIHHGADGRRYLVIHGDHFDLVVTQARWLAHLGDFAYTVALVVNRIFNNLRRRFGFGYWSLSQWAKQKVKNAVSYIGEFERTLVIEARRHAADGVICGHIHHAAIHGDFGVTYINCGDWVESCTAIAEHSDGRFEIITWTTMSDRGEVDPEMDCDVEIVPAAWDAAAEAGDLVDAMSDATGQIRPICCPAVQPGQVAESKCQSRQETDLCDIDDAKPELRIDTVGDRHVFFGHLQIAPPETAVKPML